MCKNARNNEKQKLLTENQDLIDKEFFSLELFGYPVVFVPEEFWAKNSKARAFHSSLGLIAIKNSDYLSLQSVRDILIHEFVHAINKYKIKNLNPKTVEKGMTWYEPLETFNPEAREMVRNFYKKRIFRIFREEIQTYYTRGLFSDSLDNFFDEGGFVCLRTNSVYLF